MVSMWEKSISLKKGMMQVSDAITHAVDAPAEPKKDPEWRALHDKYTKELKDLKVCL